MQTIKMQTNTKFSIFQMELKTYGQRYQAIYSLQACIKIQAFRLIKLKLKIIIIISIIITYESSVKKKMLIDLKLCVAQ